MTRDEFLSMVKSRGATVFDRPATPGEIERANIFLQQMRNARIPAFLLDLYSVCGAINLGAGYIFGISDTPRTGAATIPSLLDVNHDFSSVQSMWGKTLFGRNDLFLFAFDAYGVCYMLDNLGLRVLRQYDDPYRAMIDCLSGGKII